MEEQALSIDESLRALDFALRLAKPNDRSDVDRCYAVAITELEKLRAYLLVYCFISVTPLGE
jgi:hypothetical protein